MQASQQSAALNQFIASFDQHVGALLQSHLRIIMDKRAKFVGTKTLCAALKTVQVGIKYAKTRKFLQEHINTILFELSLPLMLISEQEYNIWNENPIEYVRLQVDQSNYFNPKAIVKTLVKSICSIKQARGQKVSPYLQSYLQVLATNLEQPSQDFRVKEAILHALGNLHELISRSKELLQNIEPLLSNFAYNELSSSNPMLRARACWVYGKFGKIRFDEGHLTNVLNAVYANLSSPELPVKVEAALALDGLLEHETAVEFLRPGLETVLRTYLKIMDEIDFDELVKALKSLVDVYEEEIAPYAVSLCQTLGNAFLRLLAVKGAGDDEDQETCLTAEGLMNAVRNVLKSISGKEYAELYPQLEAALEQPLLAALSEAGQCAVEDGLTCIAELLYNQGSVSPRMWQFYMVIVDLVVGNKGVLDEFLPQAAVPLINFMNKSPNEFRAASFEGHGSCMDMMFALIGRIFEVARAKECEIEAMCAVTLLIALLENVQGIEGSLPNILEFLVRELQAAKTPEYKSMLSQGVCMALFYSAPHALAALEQMGVTSSFLGLLFQQAETLKNDFEIKRFIIGLSTLMKLDQGTLPQSVQQQLPGLAKAAVFLCQKSIVLREKALHKERAEECEDEVVEDALVEAEDDDCELLSDEEDDEDYDCQDDLEGNQLYDSKLDAMDEVIYFRDVFCGLEQASPQLYAFYLGCLDASEQAAFQQAIAKALEYQQQPTQ